MALRLGPSGATGNSWRYGVLTPGKPPDEKIHRPTLSSGANWSSALIAALFASSILVEPASGTASPIDPDTSMTMRTSARLRSSAHDSEIAWSTGGDGGDSTAFGSAGRRP